MVFFKTPAINKARVIGVGCDFFADKFIRFTSQVVHNTRYIMLNLVQVGTLDLTGTSEVFLVSKFVMS